MTRTFHVFLLFHIFQIISAKCYIKPSIPWDEDWYNHQKEIVNFSGIMCHDTSLEDLTYELFDLGIPYPASTNLPLLSITNSNFSLITYLPNPITLLHKTKLIGSDFSGLALNFCKVKTIVGDAFKDFNHLTEIDLGFNDIDDLSFVSYLPKSVKKLNLTNNKVETLNFKLFNIVLDSLDLSFNKLTHLAVTTGYVYVRLVPVKRYLFLNNNNITRVQWNPGVNVYNSLKINLADNNIQLFGNKNDNDLSQLKPCILILSNNKLSTMDTKYDFRQCRHLDFSNCSLRSISNITFQNSNYVTLNFSRNNLELLEESFFAESRIETLDLSYNRLENLDRIFAKSFIFNLNLAANEISELPSSSFQNVESLYNLDLTMNKLKLNDSSFLYCKDTVILNLASNGITEIGERSFEGLWQLRTLKLENNMLKALNSKVFAPLQNVDQINLSNNKLTIIQSNLFNALPAKSIEVSGNDLERIEPKAFHNLSSIRQIKINNNNRPLTIDNKAFSHLPELQEIMLINSNISEINLRIFSHLPQLRVLDVKHNNLISIDFSNHSEYMNIKELDLTLTGKLTKKSFLKMIFLERLTFWNSKIHQIEGKAFQGLFNLKILELQNTTINQLDFGAFDGLFAIINLDVRSILKGQRTLNSSMFRNLHTITVLNLTSIELENIMPSAFQGLYSLKELYLSHNNLSSFQNSTFSGLEELPFLDLSYNNLVVLKRDDFQGLSGLLDLNLDNNNINDIELRALQNFPSLLTLSMARNNLTEFKVGAFSNLYNLIKLDIRQNSITALLSESFLPLRSLQSLNLEFNNLKTFGHLPLVSNLKFLKRIGIAKNKWKCEYLASMLITFRKFQIDYSSENINYYDDNIEGIECVDVCKYLLCLKDSHGIN